MNIEFSTCVAFTGHRTYDRGADDALCGIVAEFAARGFRTFLCGMAVGFDLAAAAAVLRLRDAPASSQSPAAPALLHPAASLPAAAPVSSQSPAVSAAPAPLRLIAVVPFAGQQERFSPSDRERFERIVCQADATVTLSPKYSAGCYAARNNYLVDHASALIAWYDGSKGGTHYTVRRAMCRGLEIVNLCRHGGLTLF